MADQPERRPRRSLPDLSSLYDSISEPSLESLVEPQALSRPSPGPAQPALAIPPELQTYLPADLWRKLSGGAPRSGILINALDRLRSLLYLVSTYLPGHLVQEKMSRPAPGLVEGKMLSGCLLFADVSGFTALTERLSNQGSQGAEILTAVINQYFAVMIDILSWSGGALLKFAGDAVLIYFPEQANGMHAQWAARTGLRLLRAVQELAGSTTAAGAVTLTMKVGIAAGSFLAASVGSARRMEYVLIGPAVAQVLQAESQSGPGKIVANAAAAALAGPAFTQAELKGSFCALQPVDSESLDAFEIRPEKRRARGAMPWSASPEEILAEIDLALRQVQALTPYLASELVDRIVAHANQRKVQSEFRPTTVLFCNFWGPEALLEQWGPDGERRVTALLSAYFNEMSEIITQYGGIVSRLDPYSQGTKLLALFGAPTAHEDDPQRAVSAALAMNAALQSFNQRWARKLARHLPGEKPVLVEHRVGITLGETFAGQAGSSTRREYTVMGDVVNLAARLMSVSRPGQILISQPVQDSIRACYLTRALPPVRLKGKSKLVPIFAVDGPRDDTLLTRLRGRGPLIGREPELARWQQILGQARQGRGAVVSLVGPAGIGKSHLADVALKQAEDQGWQLLAYPCRSYLARQEGACWSGLLRSLASITSLDHSLIQAEKVDRLAAQWRLSPAHRAALAGLLGLGVTRPEPSTGAPTGTSSRASAPDASGEEDLLALVKHGRTTRRGAGLDLLTQLSGSEGGAGLAAGGDVQQQALVGLLSAVAGQAPAVVFFEDAQWMDPVSRTWLRDLARDLCDRPLVFLLALRPQEDGFEPGEILSLDPFTLEETHRLVSAVLIGDLVQVIHEQSSGSPLFVEEITRWIQQTRQIGLGDLKSVLQSSNILQQLVLSSLENLPEGQREIARLGSVIGMEFYRSELEALQPSGVDPVTLSGSLRALVQTRLITLSEAGVDPRYNFAQSVFRDILYASLPHERRRDLHARLAEHLLARSNRRQVLRDKIAAFLDAGPAADPVVTAERLAEHFEKSEQWIPAAGQLSGAAGWLDRLGETARAEHLYRRALGLLERSPEIPGPEKAVILAWLGDAAVRREDLPAAVADYESAFAAVGSQPPAELAVPLTARAALVSPAQDRLGAGLALLEKVTAQCAPGEEWPLQAARAWLIWRSGADPAGAVQACRSVLPPAEEGQAWRGTALLADLSGAWADAAGLYQASGQPVGAALAWVRLGDQLLRAGSLAEAGERYLQAQKLWQVLEYPSGLALGGYRQAELAWQGQDHRTTLARLEKALDDLAQADPALQIGPRVILQRALARVKNRQPGPWDPWQWQPTEDLFYLQLLLPLFRVQA